MNSLLFKSVFFSEQYDDEYLASLAAVCVRLLAHSILSLLCKKIPSFVTQKFQLLDVSHPSFLFPEPFSVQSISFVQSFIYFLQLVSSIFQSLNHSLSSYVLSILTQKLFQPVLKIYFFQNLSFEVSFKRLSHSRSFASSQF